MLQKFWEIKVTRFAAVGVFNTLLDLSILNLLVFIGHIPAVAANLVSASISMSISYFLNHHIVFRSKEPHSIKRFVHFFLVTGVGILAIQSLVIYGVTHILSHFDSTIANLLSDLHIKHLSVQAFKLNAAKLVAVLVAMIWNFTIYHFVIFRNNEEKLDEDVLA